MVWVLPILSPPPKVILYLGNMLSRHGGSVSVIETMAPRLAELHPLRAYSSQRHQVLRLLEMLWAILAHVRSANIVLIDAYSSPRAFLYLWVTSQLCRLLRIPYMPILHGGDFPQRLQQWPRLCAMVFRHSRFNVAPSGYLSTAFENHGFRTELIPNVIELGQYPFKHRKTLSPQILWVRAFHQIYRPDLAIQILAALVRKYPQAGLCMVGADKDGSMEQCLELAQRLGVAEKVEFTGRLSKSEWIGRSSHYDIFLNTTNFDNMPVSVIEAMALGLPVVSTDVGGLPYLIEHEQTGLLTAPENSEAMTEAILRLLSDAELSGKLSLAGRAKAETLSWETVKAKWLEILAN